MAGVLADLIAFEDRFFDLMRNTFDSLHVSFIYPNGTDRYDMTNRRRKHYVLDSVNASPCCPHGYGSPATSARSHW
jgi:hypothetical protein